jgi:hypothetical protein
VQHRRQWPCRFDVERQVRALEERQADFVRVVPGLVRDPIGVVRMVPYVDGPLLARVLNSILDRIVCGHMSGLLLRSHLTAAKMASATRVPNKLAACHCRGTMRSFACLGSIDHAICSCSCKSGIRSARESCGLFPCPTDLYPAHATSVDAACAR